MMKPSSASTPIAFIRSVVLAYERYGMNPDAALRAAHISPALLRRADGWVTADQMALLCGHAMRELDDEALGWFSRRLRWGSNGFLCRASLPSANLGLALARWCRHYSVLTDDVRIELIIDGTSARLSIHEVADLREQREFCVVSLFRSIHGYACWLIDSRIPLSRASFPFAAPKHAACYPLMFRGPVVFEEAHASIRFDRQYLGLPVRRTDQDLHQMLLHPLPLIVLQYRRDRLLSHQIQKLLRTRVMECVTADAVAMELNTSTRSLYRHLADEGTSLQELKDQVRRDQAIQQLTQTAKALKQIALASGFRNEASFSRAFRQWTGQSPGEYRESVAREI